MPKLKVGFTGTRRGMTAKQKERFDDILSELRPTEFHHGCCRGADIDAHYRAAHWVEKIVGHPPVDMSFATLPDGIDELRSHLPYLIRNHNIVDETQILIATPAETEPVLRSGTWATIRYAKKAKKKTYIIYPDGHVTILRNGASL
jgi:hypothetical protein